MGEVYRARDSKLARDVAIKVLPATLAGDTDRLSRFEREARAASALNHPNIVTIYEVDRVDGTSFMAMELIEGKTLRDLLGAGPLPVKKLLSVAAQIADGLAKAHDAGIVHRDLKPENVMVTRDGLVKILDFGLAKLVRSGFERSRGVDTPTATRPTEAGTVLGTVGYMSPEQASGEPADFRSDQFSLGTILYEMITARRAFERPTLAQTLTAIIESEPDALATAAPRTPAHLVWIVERCLSKDPQDRYASTTDLARDLAALRDRASGVSISDVEPPAARRPRLSRGLLAAAAVAVAAAAVLAAIVAARRSVPYQAPTFQQLTFRRGRVLRVRYTPDGGSIIYGAAWEGGPWEIFTSRLDGTESRPFVLYRIRPIGYSILVSRFSRIATASCVPSGLQSAATTFSRSSRMAPPARGTTARVPLAANVFLSRTASSPLDETARTSASLAPKGRDSVPSRREVKISQGPPSQAAP